MNNRTSAAKAAHARAVYGTAEAVPFVQRLACQKSNLDKAEPLPTEMYQLLLWSTHAPASGEVPGR
jgi:hypothetical protein